MLRLAGRPSAYAPPTPPAEPRRGWQADGLVAWYPFLLHEYALDFAGRGNHLDSIGASAVGFRGHPDAGMGIYVDSATDELQTAASPWGVPTTQAGPITLAVWFRMESTGTNGSVMLRVSTAGSTSIVAGISFRNSTNKVRFQYGVTTSDSTTVPTVGRLMHAVFVVTGAQSRQAYVNGLQELNDTTTNVSASLTPVIEIVGTASAFTLFDARVYNYAMNAAQVQALYDPQMRWDLYRRLWVPLHLAKGAAGGTGYTQSVAGTVTSAGAVARQSSRALISTLVSSGAISKQSARAVLAALASEGALQRETGRAVTGSLTTAGVIVRDVSRAVTGGVTTAGAVAKETARAVTGTLTTGGSLQRLVARSLAGELGLAGGLVRLVARALTAALTTAGALAAVKTALVSLTAALSLSGALVRSTGKATDGSLASSGVVSRLTARSLGGTLALAGTLAKLTARALTGLLTWAGTLVGVVSTPDPLSASDATLFVMPRRMTDDSAPVPRNVLDVPRRYTVD
jgi:hypothetical protein